MMKVLITVGVYLCLVFVLGLVLAMIAPRESLEQDPPDEDR